MKLADGIIKLAIKLDRINSPLAYRLFKLATPVAFEADNLQYGNKPYEIVYRIQNASGKGFWQNPEEWNSIQDYNKFQNYETIKVTNNLPYLQVPHNDHGFLLEERQDANFQGRLFAFESTQQADRFIMPPRCIMSPIKKYEWLRSALMNQLVKTKDVENLLLDSKIPRELLQLTYLYLIDIVQFKKDYAILELTETSSNSQFLIDKLSHPLLLVRLTAKNQLEKMNIDYIARVDQGLELSARDWIESLIQSNEPLEFKKELAYPFLKPSIDEVYDERYILQVISGNKSLMLRTIDRTSEWHRQLARLILESSSIDIIYTIRQVRISNVSELAQFLINNESLVRAEAERLIKLKQEKV